MGRSLQNKAKDEAMMKAFIMANSRIKYDERGTLTTGNDLTQPKNTPAPKYTMPIYLSRQPMYQDKSAAYKASMWLFGKPKK